MLCELVDQGKLDELFRLGEPLSFTLAHEDADAEDGERWDGHS